MALDTLPFFDRLDQGQRVIIAGAGGGYDVLCGLPLYFYLRERGKAVTLANLSFSNLFGVEGRELRPQLIEVGAEAGGSKHFFPEKYLSQWFESRGEKVKVWCFHRTGAIPLLEAYQALVEETKADTVVLVDGDSDVLLRGDEEGLGTPQEDMASLAAVDQLRAPVKHKLLVCTGLGAETSGELHPSLALEAVAELSETGDCLGAWMMQPVDREVQLFAEATRFVLNAQPDQSSVLASSIAAAAKGEFGEPRQAAGRGEGGKVVVNPLMALLWTFDLTAVARRCLYLGQVKRTRTYRELNLVIENFRSSLPEKRSPQPIQL